MGQIKNKKKYPLITPRDKDFLVATQESTGKTRSISVGDLSQYVIDKVPSGGIEPPITKIKFKEDILPIVDKTVEIPSDLSDFNDKNGIIPDVSKFQTEEQVDNKIHDYSIKDVKTIADLRLLEGKEGQEVRLLGYYEVGDKPPLLYKWVSGVGEDDGGSVIVGTGGYWSALFVDGALLQDFGVFSGFHDYTKLNNIMKIINDKGLDINIHYLDIEVDGSRQNIWFEAGFMPPSNSTLNIVKSTFKQKTTNSPHYSIFSIINKKRVTINGDIVVYGDKDTHTGTSGEWGYGFVIFDSDEIKTNDIYAYDMWGDGVNVDGQNGLISNNAIKLGDIYVDGCRRQGLTISSCNIMKVGKLFASNIQGTAPMAGLDVEPNIYQRVTDLEVGDVHLKNCKDLGIAIASIQKDSIIDKVKIGDIYVTGTDTKDVVSVYGRNENLEGVAIVDNIKIGDVYMDNCKARILSTFNNVGNVVIGDLNITQDIIDKQLIYSLTTKTLKVGNVNINASFDNINENIFQLSSVKYFSIKSFNIKKIQSCKNIFRSGNSRNIYLNEFNIPDNNIFRVFSCEYGGNINIFNSNLNINDPSLDLMEIININGIKLYRNNIKSNSRHLVFSWGSSATEITQDCFIIDNIIDGNFTTLWRMNNNNQERIIVKDNLVKATYTNMTNTVKDSCYIIDNLGKSKMYQGTLSNSTPTTQELATSLINSKQLKVG